MKRYEKPALNDAHPAVYAARLFELDEHKHIKENELLIEYLIDSGMEKKGGKRVLATVHQPMVQGKLRRLFDQLLLDWFELEDGRLDYLIVIDGEFWRDASDREREALMYHELCHIKQALDDFGSPRFNNEGKPVMMLVDHDVSAFNAEVERYGAWSPDLQSFAEKLQIGG